MSNHHETEHGCCPRSAAGISRRTFFGGVGATVGGTFLSGVSWPSVAAAARAANLIERSAVGVKPILVYDAPQRREQTSWRHWGGIQSEEQAHRELARIQQELGELERKADFPIHFLPVSAIRTAKEVSQIPDLNKAQVLLVYAAGGWTDVYDNLGKSGKDVVLFVRHKSGPVYLWYEIVSPRYLRRHTDQLCVRGVDFEDVVVDSQEEVLWRLRSLCGLHNTRGTRIVAVGGPSAWSQPPGVVPDLVRQLWELDIQTVTYEELGKLITSARDDSSALRRAREEAAAYLETPGTRLETGREYVENCFLLEQVFVGLMQQAGCRALTVNSCMGTIIPMAKTTACLTLTLLNDSGYLAFCESDFVAIPSGILLANISGKPAFLNNPTYPHDGQITLAHCTAPRRNDGVALDPARIMTHYESDYGAAPKVDMKVGQVITMIAPDFSSERWVGLSGEIIENPMMEVCRSQIEVRYHCDSRLLARRMPGFHWMAGYGNYLQEIGYALKKIPISWDCLG
jgi:hypothetical protein